MENNTDQTPSSNDIPNPKPNPNPNPNPNPRSTTKGKSCTGWTYYSSGLKAQSKNPACIGFSKTLQKVPTYRKGEMEIKISKEGRDTRGFQYHCIGYSLYLDNKNSPAGSQDKALRLPGCSGLEMGTSLTKKKKMGTSSYYAPDADHVPAPANAHKSEERDNATPQPRMNKPPNVTEDQFLSRFQKNAILVAKGCVKNLSRMGSYLKETIDDIINKRPK